MQKQMRVIWVQFNNNHAKLTGNGIRILRERQGWDYDTLQRRSGVSVEDLEALENGYLPGVRVETLLQVASAFGFRQRGRLAELGEDVLRLFESQTRQMP